MSRGVGNGGTVALEEQINAMSVRGATQSNIHRPSNWVIPTPNNSVRGLTYEVDSEGTHGWYMHGEKVPDVYTPNSGNRGSNYRVTKSDNQDSDLSANLVMNIVNDLITPFHYQISHFFTLLLVITNAERWLKTLGCFSHIRLIPNESTNVTIDTNSYSTPIWSDDMYIGSIERESSIVCYTLLKSTDTSSSTSSTISNLTSTSNNSSTVTTSTSSSNIQSTVTVSINNQPPCEFANTTPEIEEADKDVFNMQKLAKPASIGIIIAALQNAQFRSDELATLDEEVLNNLLIMAAEVTDKVLDTKHLKNKSKKTLDVSSVVLSVGHSDISTNCIPDKVSQNEVDESVEKTPTPTTIISSETVSSPEEHGPFREYIDKTRQNNFEVLHQDVTKFIRDTDETSVFKDTSGPKTEKDIAAELRKNIISGKTPQLGKQISSRESSTSKNMSAPTNTLVKHTAANPNVTS